MNQVKTEIEGIVRDVTNGALLNKDNDSLISYKKLKQKNAEIEMMKSKIITINNEISDIKALLNRVLEKIG